MDWTNISDVASMIGGLLVSGFIIWQVIEKAFGNIEWIQKRKKKQFEKKETFLRDEYNKLTKEFVEHFVPPILSSLEKKLDAQDAKLSLLIRANKDMLRCQLKEIYYKYLPTRTIPSYEKAIFCKLYQDYREEGGNSEIEMIWNEIQDWEVVKETNL